MLCTSLCIRLYAEAVELVIFPAKLLLREGHTAPFGLQVCRRSFHVSMNLLKFGCSWITGGPRETSHMFGEREAASGSTRFLEFCNISI